MYLYRVYFIYMNRIVEYTDYREYLRDFYEDRKKTLPVFSYRYFCIKAGVKSPMLFKEVLQGKRNLTSKTIQAFIKGLGLTSMDAQYFIALVHFNQSKNSQEKSLFLEQMLRLRKKVTQKLVPIDQYEYYSQWYYSVLRELACFLKWNDDYSVLANAIDPPIKKTDARKGIKFLLEKGFLKKNPDGTYSQENPALTSGSEVTSIGVRSFNETMGRYGVEAISKYPKTERDIRSLVIGVSSRNYALIKEEIREFLDRVVRLVDDESHVERVYDLNIQLFPLSKNKSEGNRDNEEI